MKAAKNFITLFIGDGISFLLNFFTVVYLARTLEVGYFGIINFAFAFYAFGSFLTNLGLISVGTRDIAQDSRIKDPTAQNKYISNVISLRLFLGFLTFILLLILALIIRKPLNVKLLIIFYGFSLFPVALILEWAFLGWERMEYIAIERILIAASYLTLIFLLIKNTNNILILPIAYLVSNLLGAVFLFIVYHLTQNKSFYHKLKLKVNFNEWQQLIIQALPIGLGAILIQFSINFNTIFLGLVKSDVDVGLFSAANKLLVFILIFDRVFCNTTFPIISRYFIMGKAQLSILLTRLGKLVFTISIPICVGGFMLSPNLIKLIYGATYQSGFSIFRILVWFLLIAMLNSLCTSSLIAGKKTKDYIWAIGIGVIANVILNLILVPIIAGLGTAIALVTAELVTFIVLMLKIKSIVQIKFILSNIIKPIIATVVMAVIIKLLVYKLSVIPLIVLAAFVYGITIILIKGFNKEDLGITKAAQ